MTVKESLGDPSDLKFLIGYFISNEEGIKEEEVIKYLSSHLPQYMIPHRLIQLSSFPLNFSGKIDLSGLPDPIFTRSKNFLEPSNEIERQVRKIWAETLRLEESTIGIQDDFFELGGNSILAIRLAFNLSKEFKIFISTKTIFNHRTIEKIVKELNHLEEEGLIVSQSSFNSLHDQSLSFGQERLYFIHQLQGGSSAYNIPLIFKINDNSFDLEAFKASIKKIIERHEILRTHIDEDKNGNLYQWADQEIGLSTLVKEASVGTQEEFHALLETEISHVFDFAHEAPLRIVVCKVAEGDCHLSFFDPSYGF